MANKHQERAGYAWMFGARRKDCKERVVPPYWEEWAEAWLQGFDGPPLAGASKTKLVSDKMEAEVEEVAVDNETTATGR